MTAIRSFPIARGGSTAEVHVQSREAPRAAPGPTPAHDILHLAELVPVVRQRLDVDGSFPDDAVLASLKAIAAQTSQRERWRAAFNSNLGYWLALKGCDLNTALNTLVFLLPPPRS